MTEKSLNFVANNSVLRAMSLAEKIRVKATHSDSKLKGVLVAIRLKR